MRYKRWFNLKSAAAGVMLAAAMQGAAAMRAHADDGPTTRRAVPVDVAQTRPARVVDVQRTMVWDRVRQEAEAAKQLADLERSLEVARDRAAAQPDDPTNKAIVARAQRMLADARQSVEKQRKAFEEAHAAALVKAAYLGIATSPAPPVLRKQLKLGEGMGLVVDFVEPGSPAQAAGVQPYDVAVRLNDQILINGPQLAVLVRTFDPGAEVTLTVIREGRETPLKVKLVERAVKPIADTAFGPVWSDLAVRKAHRVAPRAALPANHLIEKGDVLNITLFDLEGPGLSTNVVSVVGADAKLNLPGLKEPVGVLGLEASQLQQAIGDAYKKAGVLENANVSVSVTPAAAATVEQKLKARRAAQIPPERR
jgi:hypothetical protein